MRAVGRDKRRAPPRCSTKPAPLKDENFTEYSTEFTVYSDFDETVELLAGTPEKLEPMTAIKSCNDYLRLGRTRSKSKLWRWYEKNPTLMAATWAQICRYYVDYDWVSRGNLYDMEKERELNEEAREAFNTGLALAHERVRELERLYHEVAPRLVKLPSEEQGQYTYNQEKGWVDESGAPLSKRAAVDTDVLQQMRGLLDDLAAETGGRSKTLNVFAKTDPMQALFDSLQRVTLELPSGQTAAEIPEAIDASFTVEGVSGPGEGDEPTDVEPEYHPVEIDRPGDGSRAVSGASGGDSSSAPEPDGTG